MKSKKAQATMEPKTMTMDLIWVLVIGSIILIMIVYAIATRLFHIKLF